MKLLLDSRGRSVFAKTTISAWTEMPNTHSHRPDAERSVCGNYVHGNRICGCLKKGREDCNHCGRDDTNHHKLNSSRSEILAILFDALHKV